MSVNVENITRHHLRINLDTVSNISYMFNFVGYLDNNKIPYTYEEPYIVISLSTVEYSYDSFICCLNKFKPGEIEIYSEDRQYFITRAEITDPIIIGIGEYIFLMRNGITYVKTNDDNKSIPLGYLIKNPKFRKYFWNYSEKRPQEITRLINCGFISVEAVKDIEDEYRVPF